MQICANKGISNHATKSRKGVEVTCKSAKATSGKDGNMQMTYITQHRQTMIRTQ